MMIQWESKYHPSLIGTPKEKIWLFSVLDDETYEAYLNDTQKVLAEKETGSYIDNLYIEN